MIIKDFYKLDVYRFDFEKVNTNMIEMNINNAISWDTLKIKMTRDELAGLSQFINTFLQEEIQTDEK